MNTKFLRFLFVQFSRISSTVMIFTMLFAAIGVNPVNAAPEHADSLSGWANKMPMTSSNYRAALTGNYAINGMASYWRFDEGSGTTAHDSSDSNPGAIHGASWATGQVGSALSFSGSNNYVQIPDSSNLTIPARVTVEAWIRPSGFDPYEQNAIIAKWKDSAPYSHNYFLGLLNNGVAIFYVGINGEIKGVNGTYLQLNQWSHLVGTYDGSEIRLYINGLMVKSQAVSGSLWTGPTDIYIGASPEGQFPRYFQGLIDEAAVYNRALTPQEIQLHYQYGLAGFGYDYIDTIAPAVNTFTVATPSNTLNIPITAFSATDAIGVTGYLITESATQPSAGAAGWSDSAPTSYAVASDGNYTLYPWAKDAADNVSAVFASPRTIEVDTLAPDTQIDAQPANPSYVSEASFSFSSADGTATFECSLEGGAFTACTSPENYTGLAYGAHTFAVRAKDPAGNLDLTPASSTWTILDTSHTAGIRYATPGGTGNCSSWANACTARIALTTAISGDEIWTAAGTYTPTTGTDHSATFQLKSGVALYGGFAGTETIRDQRNPATNLTILSGDLKGDDVGLVNTADNVYHVVIGAPNATLDGFTIRGGIATAYMSSPNNAGGGVLNVTSSMILSNDVISGNVANYGGGMVISDGSSPTLTNVTFSGNLAGGGLGGGVFINNGSNPTFINVTFSGNSAGEFGGGIYNSNNSNPTLINVTFTGNSAAGGGAIDGGIPTLRNTILWGNTAGAGSEEFYESTPIIGDSVVQGGCPTGSTCTNIITADPKLGTLGNYGGYTETVPLLAGSSAIDAGNDATCSATDQRGITRPQGAHCDIGAYELVQINTPPALPSHFYGYIHYSANPPLAGGTVEAYVPGVVGSIASATIVADGSDLGYQIDVPGDLTGTLAKDGGQDGDMIAFKIAGRVVATGVWHSGTNIHLDFHPPEALPGGPYSGNEGSVINFSGSGNDAGPDITTYQWDWENDGIYDANTQTASHTWTDNGTYTVGLKVTDALGGEGKNTVVITVNNVAPTATLAANSPIDEGNASMLSFTLPSDPSIVDAAAGFHYSFACDGLDASLATTYGGAGTAPTTNCSFFDNGIYTVKGRIFDKNNGSTTYSSAVTVINVAPAVTLDSGNIYAWDESSTVERTYNYAATDPAGSNDPLAMTINCGTAGQYVASSDTGSSFKCIFADGPASPTISVYADDGDGGVTTASHVVTVNNVAPTATIGNNGPVDEGNPVIVSFSGQNDPSSADLASLHYAFDCNGGSLVSATYATSAASASQSCTFTDIGSYTVSGKLMDKDGDSHEYTSSVTVNDVLPSNVDAHGPYSGIAGQAVTLSGLATCAPVDTCLFTWDLDNDGLYDDAGGTSPTYTWNTLGTFTIGLKVTDSDGNPITDTATVNIAGATHSITLEPGWNLVSFNLHPEDTSIATVLSSIAGNYDLVYGWNASVGSSNWMKFAPGLPAYQNSLHNLDETMGFWIHMTIGDRLDVVGSVPTTTNITLSAMGGGWNLVGYPSRGDTNLPDILNTHGVTTFTLVYAYHAVETADLWKLYDIGAPGFANDLKILDPGWGYWIKVSGSPQTWVVGY